MGDPNDIVVIKCSLFDDCFNGIEYHGSLYTHIVNSTQMLSNEDMIEDNETFCLRSFEERSRSWELMSGKESNYDERVRTKDD